MGVYSRVTDSVDAWCQVPRHNDCRTKCRVHCVCTKCPCASFVHAARRTETLGSRVEHHVLKIPCSGIASFEQRRTICDELEDLPSDEIAELLALELPPGGPEPR